MLRLPLDCKTILPAEIMMADLPKVQKVKKSKVKKEVKIKVKEPKEPKEPKEVLADGIVYNLGTTTISWWD
jgi:hypothetical protein